MTGFENIQLPWSDWKIVRNLGHGGFGCVYEVERELFGRKEKAALKVLTIPKDQSEVEADFTDGYDEGSIRKKYEDYRDKVIQEYQLMSEMKGHTNIVNCDDFAAVPLSEGIGWKVYIRMELLTPLEKVLRSESLSTDQIIKLGIDICKALDLCEKKNIVHRDVKPANIMVSEFGDYKLGDFGVARTMDHTTNATSIGTEKYMAPEVIRRERYGKEADLYSLGLVLYWLLNNRRMPFVPANRIPTQDEVNTAQSRRIRGDVIPEPAYGSDALKQVVKKACAYLPKDRYHSAQEMMEALQSVGGIGTKKTTVISSVQEEAIGKQWKTENWSENTQKTAGTLGRDMSATVGNGWEDASKTIGAPRAACPTPAQRVRMRQNAGQNDETFEKTVGVEPQQTKATRPTVSERVQMRQKAQEAEANNEKKSVHASGKQKINKKIGKVSYYDILCPIIYSVLWYMDVPMGLMGRFFAECFWILMPVVMFLAIYIWKNTLVAGISSGIMCSIVFAEVFEVFETFHISRLGMMYTFGDFWVIKLGLVGIVTYCVVSSAISITKNRKYIWQNQQKSEQENREMAKSNFAMFMISMSISICYGEITDCIGSGDAFSMCMVLLLPIVMFIVIFCISKPLLAGISGCIVGLLSGAAFINYFEKYIMNLNVTAYLYAEIIFTLMSGVCVAVNAWKLAKRLKNVG